MPAPGRQAVTPVARELFAAMLAEREQRGIATYGRSLETHNGRDAVQDALEECADLWQYLVQIKLERDALRVGSEQADDARISEIRANHVAEYDSDVRDVDFGPVVEIGPYCAECGDEWPCEQGVLLAHLDALTAERDAADKLYRMSVIQRAAVLDERDALRARADRAESALRPCALALEYRDGVTCRDERDRGVCLNHRVIEGLRVHAVTADRLEIENRALRRQVRATYGIIHEGLHGGRATDPEGQATCERPSCRNARAALAAASSAEANPVSHSGESSRLSE
jgi:hypothetical protein